MVGLLALWSCGSGASSSKTPEPSKDGASLSAGLAKDNRPASARASDPAVAPDLAPDLGPWSQAWAQHRARSCDLRIQVQQGDVQGQLQGRVAWSQSQGPQAGVRVRAHVEGMLGQSQCKVRIASVGGALMVEHWEPKLRYAVTQRWSQDKTQPLVAELRRVDQPGLQALLEIGCAKSIALPPSALTWQLQRTQGQEIVWAGPQGATQTLRTQGSGRLPQRRELRFRSPAGEPVHWVIDHKCKGA